MKYNDTTGHWEMWDWRFSEWVDLYTADTNRALHLVRIYMEMPEAYQHMTFWHYAGRTGLG